MLKLQLEKDTGLLQYLESLHQSKKAKIVSDRIADINFELKNIPE